ncbi:glucose-1-phosphate cytidylyltransferase [Polynucleobacter paneuropaeus]|jgi:glucose-1-phosphate cytidylyltransferase|nr:glucose-1-phosphate cytidylyltransferase [Polynucleobacter paneuropaeus]MBT8576700.1 glucose-1-phosphate cytidylyltransferase [Polynucleobacter paneuropaeus]MBT8615093.1 glucose-1-phosphate cytidylyltransferase [Polynucleobacter paneuropaeus]MBT8616574.1 glucose-1-phosphate cytidylyltransferase [Polynucleobacter paneuropaeus]MBT8618455.1 glucose-1-phosphate cytidylyltransferase [Polynucleobacter paneuropaeus]
MKTILLAGGFGTRLSEYTDIVPKPMVPIGGRPILWHIMQHYANYGHKDFYAALGYKAEVIKEFFLNYRTLNSDFTVDLATGKLKPHQFDDVDWQVTLVDTGLATMTGGRVKRMKQHVGNETFMLTYGDGVADIDIEALIRFHRSHGKMVTISAVRPAARFGELEIESKRVVSFTEKPQLHDGWINGGYFVIEPDFFDLIKGDDTFLEREPLEQVAALGELMAYHHNGFWQCMDTKRDHEMLEKMYESKQGIWSN